jgi:hypothetical protein
MTTRLRRLLSRALLALALVFAQQVGVAHAASHLGGEAPSHEHHKGLETQACDDCLSFAQVQGAGTAAPLANGAAPRGQSAQLPLPAGSQPAFAAAFHSRAPPQLPER